MLEIKLDEKLFSIYLQDFVGRRFSTVEEVEKVILEKTGMKIRLELSSTNGEEVLEGYDERIVSNCEVNGKELCYLDLYFIKDNAKQFYITEVALDFNT